jgi:hypothetical protein
MEELFLRSYWPATIRENLKKRKWERQLFLPALNGLASWSSAEKGGKKLQEEMLHRLSVYLFEGDTAGNRNFSDTHYAVSRSSELLGGFTFYHCRNKEMEDSLEGVTLTPRPKKH